MYGARWAEGIRFELSPRTSDLQDATENYMLPQKGEGDNFKMRGKYGRLVWNICSENVISLIKQDDKLTSTVLSRVKMK